MTDHQPLPQCKAVDLAASNYLTTCFGEVNRPPMLPKTMKLLLYHVPLLWPVEFNREEIHLTKQRCNLFSLICIGKILIRFSLGACEAAVSYQRNVAGIPTHWAGLVG